MLDRLLVKKPPVAPPDSQLKKVLGWLDLTALGIGAIIGTGIFVITGSVAARVAGPGIILSFVLCAVACGFAALSYAELASMIPISGSAYTYAYASFGELVAWIIGWDLILEYVVACGVVAIGWSAYFVNLLALLGLKLPASLTTAPTFTLGGGFPFVHVQPGAIANVPAIVISLLVTWLLVVGIRESARVNTVIVGVKVLILIMFIAVAAPHIQPANWHPFVPFGWGGVGTGASLIFFAYIGFDAVSTAAEEVKNPARDLPIGIIASLAICTVFYIIVAAIFTGIVPQALYPKFVNDGAPLASALHLIGQGWAEALLTVGALAGISSVLVVMMLGQPRIFFSMARDGLLPKPFARVHPKFKTPHLATIICGVSVALMSGVIPISVLTELTNIGTLFAFILVAIGVWILRRSHPEMKRDFRVPAVPVVAIGTLISCGYMISKLPLTTQVRFVLWLVAGLVLYFFYGFQHSVAAKGKAVEPAVVD